jgi:hypothetical protein
MKHHPLRAIGATFAVLFSALTAFGQQAPNANPSLNRNDEPVQQQIEPSGRTRQIARRATARPKPQPTKLDRVAEKLKIAEPAKHGNLTIFLIEGDDRLDTSDVLTLAEALEKKGTIVVKETGNVSELVVINEDAKHTVFIMAGDIVKGGQQDRTLASDLPLRKGAGVAAGGRAAPRQAGVPIASFCVESGRWAARAGSSVAQFDSSVNSVVSNSAKLAIRRSKNQGEVWDKVAESQTKISSNVGKSVNAAASPTSLQLSLEDKDLKKQTNAYVDTLKGIVGQNKKAVGFVMAINGNVYCAEIFASHDLFQRTWPKLLESAAIEAVADLKEKAAEKAATAADAMEFLAKTEDAAATEEQIFETYWSVTAESPGAMLFQTIDKGRDGLWLRRSIIKK